jgi:hypothetical protein
MNKEYWYFLIHGLIDKRTGAYTNFYANGKHLGDALELTLKNVDKVEVYDCELIEATHLGTIDDFEMPEAAEKIADDLFIISGLSSYKVKKNEYNYITPTGIVKTSEDGEYDFDLIKEHFVAFNKDENGIYCFTMTPDKRNIEKLFFNSLEFIPSVDSLAIYLENDWENDKETELWINKGLVEKQPIIDFIKTNISNTIRNGYVSTVIYCSTGETNLVIDSHKHLKLTTKDLGIFDNFINQIKGLGFKQTRDFYSLEYGFYHWHYRPYDSLDKSGFRDLLKTNKFEILKV